MTEANEAHKRYCPNCASAVTTGRQCPACGALLPASPSDDLTTPERTLVIDRGAASPVPDGVFDHHEATTVAGTDPAPPATPLDLATLRQRLASRFEVVRLLGAGGMGQVYEARDLTLKRTVAIKCIAPELSANPEWVRRLREEARIVARMQHPGIVQVYEVIDLDGFSLMVMEYVEGEDLRTTIRGQALDRETLVDVIIEACDALAFAHDHGVIHRDIKPGNIMVTPDGHCKIMDFGIAGLAEDGAEPGSTAVGGSLPYMAPELLGADVGGDIRSDVYALGVTLYYTLCRCLPFRGARGAELAERIRDSDPTPPHEIDRTLGGDLEAICLKAMCGDADGRYRSARRLGDDLRRSRAGRPVEAVDYPVVTQVRRAMRQRPGVMLVGLAAAALLFAGMFFSASHVHREAEQAVVGELEDKIRNIAFAIAMRVPGEARQPETGPDAIDAAVRRIKQFNSGIRDAYVVAPDGGGFRVSRAWHGAHGSKRPATPGPLRGHDTWGPTPVVENPTARAFMTRALAGEVLVEREVDTDASAGNEWRQRLLGYAPLARAGQRAVLVIEVSSEAMIAAFGRIENAFRLTLLFGGLLALGLIGLTVAGVVLLWRQSR